MILNIYNGFLSDSNEFIQIDTNEISLKDAICFIDKWITYYLAHLTEEEENELEEQIALQNYYLISRANDPQYDIHSKEFYFERGFLWNKNIDFIHMKHTGWGYSVLYRNDQPWDEIRG